MGFLASESLLLYLLVGMTKVSRVMEVGAGIETQKEVEPEDFGKFRLESGLSLLWLSLLHLLS